MAALPMRQKTGTTDTGQQQLLEHYLAKLRQRFKSQVNRMTGGGMQQLLGERPNGSDLSFLLSYLHAFHWLCHNVPERYRPPLLAAFKGSSSAFLMALLERSRSGEEFVRGYIDHWLAAPAGGPIQREQLLRLLQARNGSRERVTADVLEIWEGFGLFSRPDAVAYKEIARSERDRYGEMLGEPDRERLALVDSLPDTGQENARFDKLGLIPAMGCPQTCRHCMFIWRPLMRDAEDPEKLYRLVDAHTRSVLFTGGDLTRHMRHFYRAIGSMQHVRNFAILLNGDFATSPKETGEVIHSMLKALKSRPSNWPQAHILLQISFDEFHQEVVVDRHGKLRERIPVAKIAHIVEAVPQHPEIQLALLHKQNHLNFSMELFQKGVFGRLTRELGRRGHQIQILSTAPSARHKGNPARPGQSGPLIKDASFILTRYPDNPVLLTSSTIDAYGRAELLEAGEAVSEKTFLAEVLTNGAPPGEAFDTDLMFWFNGWVTLFSAVHICLGNVHTEGADILFERHRKDPLTRALHGFDRRLLEYYSEIRADLQQRIERATGPHHLFHMLTEEGDVRLHMTRRLIKT
jgi:hypothetical protein